MILVLEDDPSLRDAIRVNLEAEGFATFAAADALAARAFLARTADTAPPGLLVASAALLEAQDGELLRWIRRQPERLAKVPIVVVTDEAPERAEELAARLRVEGALAKPFDLDRLLDLVGRYTS